MSTDPETAEERRLLEEERREKNWKRWGPYLSERQWGTVREDYSPDGEAWDYLPHTHARSRAYRWGEDGLLGLTDRRGRLCFALALWNERDPILKERLFGLTGPQGNHGEDVKEIYLYVDSTPTHSYLKSLYRYPLAEYPYRRLIAENQERGRDEREYELTDTEILDDLRFVDVTAEYAKADPDDILVRITVTNHGPEGARLHLLPTLWFRNTWSWGRDGEGFDGRPHLARTDDSAIRAVHPVLGRYRLEIGAGADGGDPTLLFTENETNNQRLYETANDTPYVKDAFHARVVEGDEAAVNPKQEGTKAAAWYQLTLAPGGRTTVELRLHEGDDPRPVSGPAFDRVFDARRDEADRFYAQRLPANLSEEERRLVRRAYAGLLHSKQFYYYVVEEWLDGDPDQPTPPEERRAGRNHDWPHLFNRDVISMPDKWEYPWYAAWDLAFHMIPFAAVDSGFARKQLELFLREWYMHPNGQMPAYEFQLGDVNPPVHAWACWRLYKMSGPRGKRDRRFLESTFQKLLLNFTWWVNRKDIDGNHLFAGGFLGLDNIGVFDRSKPLPTGGHLEQADGSAWMGFYCGTMLQMAIELAFENPAYEDMASKFFEHFIHIADAINHFGGGGLYDEQDGFYYDQLHVDGERVPLRVRSLVGLVPMFTAEVLHDACLDRLPGFKKRMRWFLENRSDLAGQITYMERHEGSGYLLAIPTRERLESLLRYLLDEEEFLSPFGIRSLSRVHRDRPFEFDLHGSRHIVRYVSGESDSGLFGGNSNWRGPIWFPMNYLIVEVLLRYHYFYGDELVVECPTGSGVRMNLKQVALELARRLVALFLPDERGRRPIHGDDDRYATDERWKEHLLFYEYFDGDDGRGLGASHQTGWTALVTRLVRLLAQER